MSFNLPKPDCESHSNRKKFGLCDDPPPATKPAYIDEANGNKWIAVVVNESRHDVTFTAIDNCIDVGDGAIVKRCDGVLSFGSTLIFVELKERGARGNLWVIDAEKQLRSTIEKFANQNVDQYIYRKAYIANSEHPKFKASQAQRMARFTDDTGYVLRIENRIILD